MEFYACGQFAELPKDCIVLRGGFFEAGQNYGRSIADSDTDGFISGMKSYYKELSYDEREKSAFKEWLDYIKKYPCAFIDIRDRFYIEQRVGGWGAAIEQSLDLNDFISLQIANCAELLSVLLSSNEEERASLALSYGSIRVLNKDLLEYPINKRTASDIIRYAFVILKHTLLKLINHNNKRK